MFADALLLLFEMADREDERFQARKLHKRLHTHCTLPTLQVGLNAKAPTCWTFAEPSDGLEPSTPSLPSRALPDTRGHVLPANRVFEACLQCPRVPERAQVDVPVSYLRTVVCSQNTQRRAWMRLITNTNLCPFGVRCVRRLERSYSPAR
jgi:hypothetical protein